MILAPLFRQQFFDSNGNPLAGGLLYAYIAGTTTPQATYTDQGGLTPNTNPVVLDSAGTAAIWIDSSLAYKFVLKDSLGNAVDQKDNISDAGQAGAPKWAATTVYSQGDTVADASGSGLFYVSMQNNNQGFVLSNVSYWRRLGGGSRTVTTNTALAITDEYVRSNSTAGNLTHTLPPLASTPLGAVIKIKDVGTGGFTTSVKGSGTDQVDGAVTYATALARYDSITIANLTGTIWDVV